MKKKKKADFDIQQLMPEKKSAFVFILLVLMLIILTYLKLAYSNDLSDMFQAMINQNLSQQIFRTQSGEITFSSTLLNLNFIVVLSLYVRFILSKYFLVSSSNEFREILFLIFLFTFFYFGKIILIKFIGLIFDLRDECSEYIFHFTTVCKTLGLTLLPALFIFYTAQEKFLRFIFILSIAVVIFFFLILIWRGLSTAYKLMYRSVYHFFIYVCVVEISTIFLLFKLLTKTII